MTSKEKALALCEALVKRKGLEIRALDLAEVSAFTDFFVIATGHLKGYRPPGKYIGGSARGDFGLWNELKARGHEIMPHGYKHANLRQLAPAEVLLLV